MFFSDPARLSTLLLTSLMVIGLAFFIRASTKDRIEVARFGSQQQAESLQRAVTDYFQNRAYRRLSDLLPEDNLPEENLADRVTDDAGDVGADSTGPVVFVGLVSPSIFMAVFLSSLAAVGFACLALIMSTLFPVWGGWCLGLLAVSPLAGIFYWRKSSRPEQVICTIEDRLPEDKALEDRTLKNESSEDGAAADCFRSMLTVRGHRDEIAELKASFSPRLQALTES